MALFFVQVNPAGRSAAGRGDGVGSPMSPPAEAIHGQSCAFHDLDGFVSLVWFLCGRQKQLLPWDGFIRARSVAGVMCQYLCTSNALMSKIPNELIIKPVA